MARSIVRANPFKPDDKRLEQIIKRLERELDKDTAHLRSYRDALNDIDLLLGEGKIDQDHADIWRSKALHRYEAAETKRQDAKAKANQTEEGVIITYPFFYSFFKKLFKED